MYTCLFPDCTYKTNDRNQIDWHHVKPKELGGSDLPGNRMWLCPNHHRQIYVPSARSGLHAIKCMDSIVINGFINSTGGWVLHFTKCSDNKEYYHMYSKRITECVDDLDDSPDDII